MARRFGLPSARARRGPVEPIAFVGNDHLLYVLDAPDSLPRCLTSDAPAGAFTWPTWAPESDALAVMCRVRDEGRERGAVELRAVADGAAQRVWTARDGGPVFMHWAPGGRRLGLLVQEGDTLQLLVADRDSGHTEMVLTGAPLYWSWAPDGAALVAHVGGHHRRGNDARLVLMRLGAGSGASETLDSRPLGFRAPAWEPTGTRVAYAAASTGDGRALVLLDTLTGQRDEVAAVGNAPSFVWAPEGGRLALAAERTDAGLYDGLRIVDTRGGADCRLQRIVLAFFWTPAGDALLCVGVDPAGEMLIWERVDAASGEARTLARFAPTQELALLIGHFDQYAPAVSLYSRTESALLFAHTSQDSRHNGHSAEHAGLWLVTDAAEPALRRLAGGSFGCFAP
jgi:dipeptidyl aminopeptidase/acylaminoacyl peptidase